MTLDNFQLANEIKSKNVIDMGLLFTSMIRLFEQNTKPKLEIKLFSEFQKLEEIRTEKDFRKFHNNFCQWFVLNVKTARRKNGDRIIKESRLARYGHAAKLIDVVLKVYVYYSNLPDFETAAIIIRFMNTAIDNPILNHLKTRFPEENIYANTVEQIDQKLYDRLQNLIKEEIVKDFNNEIIPTQYDDIMWRKFSRDN
jgi:hypothetical protein